MGDDGGRLLPVVANEGGPEGAVDVHCGIVKRGLESATAGLYGDSVRWALLILIGCSAPADAVRNKQPYQEIPFSRGPSIKPADSLRAWLEQQTRPVRLPLEFALKLHAIEAVRLRLKVDARHLPAVALTAFTRREDTARALDKGFQKHLAKPVQVGRLIGAIRQLTGRQQRTAQRAQRH